MEDGGGSQEDGAFLRRWATRCRKIDFFLFFVLKFCHYIAFGGTYTAVRLASFSTIGLEDQVLTEWKTQIEVTTAGFNVLRVDSPEGPWAKLNEDSVPGRGTSWERPLGIDSMSAADAAADPATVLPAHRLAATIGTVQRD